MEYFPRLEDRQQVLFPLHVVSGLGKVDITAEVTGGGPTGIHFLLNCVDVIAVVSLGQAGAIRVGLSRALANFADSFIEPLEKHNLTVMDTRRVERKKPGQKKARKKFAWYVSE